MLSADARSRLTVVLVGARNPQNIGAAARAMQDFGFRNLRVVNDFAPPFEAAQLEAKSAVGAGKVMQAARLFPTLQEAIADCTVVAGTTAIGDRELTIPVTTLREAAASLRAALLPPLNEKREPDCHATQSQPRSMVALLFGSEKTGLTKEQLSYCSALLSIPMFQPEDRHLSMNLGQAVAVCLYELSREGFEGVRPLPNRDQPSPRLEDRERLLSLVLEVMTASGYDRRFPANSRTAVVRQLILPVGRSRDEIATWLGLFRHILRSLISSQP
jgi:TrmH family RNA methyltransferase